MINIPRLNGQRPIVKAISPGLGEGENIVAGEAGSCVTQPNDNVVEVDHINTALHIQYISHQGSTQIKINNDSFYTWAIR